MKKKNLKTEIEYVDDSDFQEVQELQEDWSDLSFQTGRYYRSYGNGKIRIDKKSIVFFSSKIICDNKEYFKNKNYVKSGYSFINKSLIFVFMDEIKNGEFSNKFTKKGNNLSFTIAKLIKDSKLDISNIIGSYDHKFKKIENVGDCIIVNLGNKLNEK